MFTRKRLFLLSNIFRSKCQVKLTNHSLYLKVCAPNTSKWWYLIRTLTCIWIYHHHKPSITEKLIDLSKEWRYGYRMNKMESCFCDSIRSMIIDASLWLTERDFESIDALIWTHFFLVNGCAHRARRRKPKMCLREHIHRLKWAYILQEKISQNVLENIKNGKK